MKKAASLTSGLAGSVALTLLHQATKKKITNAPRMDKPGMQALETAMDKTGMPATKKNLFFQALAGELAANTTYYSLVGLNPRKSIATGAMLGSLAGIGAIALPGKMGLNKYYSDATTKTKVLTVALYVATGLIAGMVYKLMTKKKQPPINKPETLSV